MSVSTRNLVRGLGQSLLMSLALDDTIAAVSGSCDSVSRSQVGQLATVRVPAGQ